MGNNNNYRIQKSEKIRYTSVMLFNKVLENIFKDNGQEQ